jgi:CBS domain containing-hemolysin-like protein
VIGTILGLLACLALAALLSGMETGFYSLERVRLEVGAARGDRASSRLLGLLARPAPALCALLLATNAAHYVLAYFADRLVVGWTPGASEFGRKLADTLFLVPVLFVFGDLVPKNVFMRAPSGLMRRVQPFLTALTALLSPLTWPIVRIATPSGAAPAEPASVFDRGGLHYLLAVDEDVGSLTGTQRLTADRVLALRNVRVQDRMVPLAQVTAVGPEARAPEILAKGAASAHSRLPVLSEDKRRFLGYVNVVDAAMAPGDFDLRRSLYDLPSVPCDLPVTTALYRLQRAGRPIAAVTRPDGRGPLGIIAVSDIVSALFVD